MLCLSDIKNTNLPIVIFGASVVGEVIFKLLKQLSIRITAFADNNIHKTQLKFCGLSVIHTLNLRKHFEDAIFVIAAADIQDILQQLKKNGFSRWLSSVELLSNENFLKLDLCYPPHFVEYAISSTLNCHKNFLNSQKIYLRSVDIVITEKCSLRCRDCSNLMSYYKTPRNYNIDEIMSDVNNLLKIVDGIHEFRVIGGEPFMNSKIHIIVNELSKKNKIKYVIIYTNATILPSKKQLKFFNNPKILFFITDYGQLSKKLVQLLETLVNHDIKYYVQKVGRWTDCAKIYQHFRTSMALKELFEKCCAHNTYTLIRGKLFRCPFSANAHILRAVPDYASDYINIRSQQTISRFRRQIRAFLKLPYLKTCNFCNGRSFGDKFITPAVQIKHPIDYYIYN